MQTYITGAYVENNKVKQVKIFGYSTQGIPGIEIVGASLFGRILKEKLVFFCKKERIRLPLKRIVICFEKDTAIKDKNLEGLRYLEIPVLTLLLVLAEELIFGNLDECLTFGKLNLNHSIELIPPESWPSSICAGSGTQTLIIPSELNSFLSTSKWIPMEDLLKEFQFEYRV